MSAPTENLIRQLVGSRSFDRGASYFENGRIHHARRQGELLKARCYGSEDNDYRIEVRLNGAKVLGGHCSCPVGEEGTC
ncbi:MAG: hypothetical protein JNG89_05810, partial [Planctomycetaceae bacterium]|nr:hypothetical protein [Planctomycetaceae bacterium]